MARPKQVQVDNKPKATSPKKKISLNEFRAWLSGVEEMQPEGWTPEPQQWKIIRAKIEDVIADSSVSQNRFTSDGNEDEPPRMIRQAAPSAFGGPGLMPQPTTALVVVEEGASLIAAPGVKSTGSKMKTPNIDTSKGGYVAAFE